jgi:hypothetical protein
VAAWLRERRGEEVAALGVRLEEDPSLPCGAAEVE